MDDRYITFRTNLAHLTALDGVSGHEGSVVTYLAEQMRDLVDTVEVDPLGNLYATRAGGSGKHLLVEAHSDEVGALVADVDPQGFVRFQMVGGLPPSLAVGRKVRIGGQHAGVVGVRPGHFKDNGSGDTVQVNDLFIDLGASSSAEVADLGVCIGDQIAWQSELEPLAVPRRVTGKAIDNRVGCLVVLELLRALQGEDLPGSLTVAVAVQEEVGLKGAGVVAERVRPDAALIIDTVPCADTLDTRSVHTFPVGIGRGPVFQVSSGPGGRGFLLPASIRDYLTDLAKRAGIPYQLAAFAFGNTDASAVYLRAGGIPTAAATIPRRYSHSPVEVMDLDDAFATIILAREVVRHVDRFPTGILPGS